MAIFQKVDPVKKLQADLESALRSKRRDRDGLAEKLRTAEAAVITHRAKARDLACDGGDDAAISAAESKMREQQDRCVTLTGALGDVDKAVADLERQVADVVDGQTRAATAVTLAEWLAEWDRASELFDIGCRAIEAISTLTGPTFIEAVATGHFASDARQQLPRAVEVITLLLESRRRGVLAGAGPATLAQPPQPPPRLAVVPPSEPTMNIFIKKHVKYVDAAGNIVCLRKNRRYDVPKHLAELALSSHLALPLTERKLIAELEYNSDPHMPVDETNCEWLGPKGREAAPKSMTAPVIHSSLTHSAFEPHPNIGKPYSVAVPRGPEPEPMAATGTRSAEDGEP
jgi:hypothetical protein